MMDILLCKCRTRQEQAYLVVGMVILTVCSFGVCKFALGMGKAARATDVDGRFQRDVNEVAYYGYMIFGISALLGLAFAFMGILNLVRLVTGTGLDESDGSWD